MYDVCPPLTISAVLHTKTIDADRMSVEFAITLHISHYNTLRLLLEAHDFAE